ncbi:hypothetical protein DUK53_16945 [Listeria sp. SHR_NRA_18]|uniref:hypothetical protein n=1 Tax=Listeria sp. SHR_NRA_18 TaxID=2269046 RepID=UPI000F5DEFE5|nr:hypothetical protein [Listeria sp. SHR_NRA_18]RQW65323.1 hypothetical protein DUK53_16945 [Listeria sp. SHR_NRA_18]
MHHLTGVVVILMTALIVCLVVLSQAEQQSEQTPEQTIRLYLKEHEVKAFETLQTMEFEPFRQESPAGKGSIFNSNDSYRVLYSIENTITKRKRQALITLTMREVDQFAEEQRLDKKLEKQLIKQEE